MKYDESDVQVEYAADGPQMEVLIKEFFTLLREQCEKGLNPFC